MHAQRTVQKSTPLTGHPPVSGASQPGAGRLHRTGQVSVIIPAYNAAATIDRTISSVLDQSYRDLEVLVVDDGSTDETAVIVRRMAAADNRVRLLQKANGGLVSARNYGIAHANGEFIAPIDADDLWHPTKIVKQVALMQERGDHVGLVYTWARGIDEQDRVFFDLMPCRFRGNVYAALIMKNFVGSGAPLVRTQSVDEVGGYDATLFWRGADCCADFKFSLDIAERYQFDFVPEFLWGYRFRAGSMSTDIEAMLLSHDLIVCDARRRHPELPPKLFRWARAHQYLEFGLTHLSNARLLQGGWLLLKAISNDPSATLQGGLQRVSARLRRSSTLIKLMGAGVPCDDDSGIVARKFFEIDPTAFCSRPTTQLSRSRFAYVTGLRVERDRVDPFAANHTT